MYTICDLILMAKTNNHESMMELYTRFRPLIKKYAYKLNYEDADGDLTVNFIQIIHDMPTFNNEGQAVSYIEKSIYNAYTKYVRLQVSQRENECLYDPEIISNIDLYSYQLNEPNIDLHKAIKQLSIRQRKIIIYKYFYMLSDKEIMNILHISRQSVYKNKTNALQKLKQLLGK